MISHMDGVASQSESSYPSGAGTLGLTFTMDVVNLAYQFSWFILLLKFDLICLTDIWQTVNMTHKSMNVAVPIVVIDVHHCCQSAYSEKNVIWSFKHCSGGP